MEHWYFTFMGKQPLLKDFYVKIEGNVNETRNKLCSIIGDKWGFQYNESDFLPQIKKYGLKKISIDDLAKDITLARYED